MSDLMDVSCKSRDNQHASSDTTKVASIAERTEALSVPDVNAMHDYISQFFKDGKIVFQEPKLRPENHVEINAKIVRFRQLRLSLEQRAITEGDNLSQISAEYYDLVAALVQDSDESLSVLTMRLNDLLSPFNRYEEAADCYSEWIERTIKQVAHRERYGLQASILNDLEGAPATVPLNLSVFRWESKNISIFPQDLQTAIEMRRYARRRMTETVMNVFHSLPAEQQISLLNTKHRKPHFTVTKERVDELVVDEARKAAEEAEKEEKRKKKVKLYGSTVHTCDTDAFTSLVIVL
ncbi:uncharacterized protein BYT42DRAFT_121964 [Radiomyces spectabilis]|uniref:uncharacterized protein n=1 Tax=Radiomyces spectabilis TaxID=64574 RepID=UPI0022205868|nr:uncharacterized protein BYT42DRAFT_121964 [Radiomyces spectabilis]KAI8368203.1 hypothetical protein BYT42DRAFT_121964 [Radiomyces spectabilis]